MPAKTSRLSKIRSLSIESLGQMVGKVKDEERLDAGLRGGMGANIGLAIGEIGERSGSRRDRRACIEGRVQIRTETVQWASSAHDSTPSLRSTGGDPTTSADVHSSSTAHTFPVPDSVYLPSPPSPTLESDAESSRSCRSLDTVTTAVMTRQQDWASILMQQVDNFVHESRGVTPSRTSASKSGSSRANHLRTASQGVGEIGSETDRGQDYYFYAT